MSNNNSSEDFWDLDDDDFDLDAPSPAETAPPEVTQEAAPAPVEEAAPEPVAEPVAEPAPEPALVQKTSRTSKRRSESRGRDRTSATEEKRKLLEMSLIEKISVLAVLLCVGGAAALGLSTYFEHAPNGELITFNEDFPVEGDSVTIAGIETWWRKPIREGENADRGVRLPINLIPCARIKIQDTKDALLWVTFRNGDQDLVGDPINLLVSNGKFVGSDSEEIEIHATSGFMSPSEINSYTNGDVDPWSVVIVESSDGEEFSSESEPFIKVLIEAKVPEETEVE